MKFKMLTGTASSPETSNITISLKSEGGLKKWLDLDPGNVLLFLKPFFKMFAFNYFCSGNPK